MRKRPIIIALSVAGIIAGTHAGIAAINSEITTGAGVAADSVAMQTESQIMTEAVMPVETTATTAAEMQAPVETQAPVAQTPIESVVQPKWALTPAPEPARAHVAASSRSDERMVRIPFTNRYVRVTNPTFPSAATEISETQPSVIAYFDRRTANTMLTGAPGQVFPSAAVELSEPSPATVAHFNQVEARRLAALQPVASVAAANGNANANDKVVAANSSTTETPGN